MQKDLSEMGLPVQWSYGIFLYHIDNKETLMVQRRDTIEYIELVKGHISCNDLELLEVYVNRLTKEERDKLLTASFDTIWFDLWCNHNHKNFHKQYWPSYHRFQQLRPLIKRFDAQYEEREFVLPRGRMIASDQSELCTAQRECYEETGIRHDQYVVTDHVLKECYLGSDNTVYGTKYFVCTIKSKPQCVPSTSEVKGCHWVSNNTFIDHIRSYRHHTKHLFYDFETNIAPRLDELDQ